MITRTKELKVILKSNLFNSCSMVFTWGACAIIGVVIVGFLLALGYFDVTKVFTLISLVTLCADAIGFLP